MNTNEWMEFHKSNFEEFWKEFRKSLVFDEDFTEDDWIRETLVDITIGSGKDTIEMIRQWIRNHHYLKSDISLIYREMALLSMVKDLVKEFAK